MTNEMAVPEPAVEFRLAAGILAKREPLERAILEDLVGGSKRYRELKEHLAGRNDNVLTKALTRLRGQGVIKQGVELAGTPPTKTYSLTRLGVLVVFRLHEMVPMSESIRAWRLGQVAA